jgi:NAD(P)-dependent dehydrogenase (short-subunit alcohol dehydrogenase family)
LYALNVRTTFLASQAALPHLLASSQGRIVNVGAISAGSAMSGMGAYAAAKSGVARLTEALAEEFKDRGAMRLLVRLPANVGLRSEHINRDRRKTGQAGGRSTKCARPHGRACCSTRMIFSGLCGDRATPSERRQLLQYLVVY